MDDFENLEPPQMGDRKTHEKLGIIKEESVVDFDTLEPPELGDSNDDLDDMPKPDFEAIFGSI